MVTVHDCFVSALHMLNYAHVTLFRRELCGSRVHSKISASMKTATKQQMQKGKNIKKKKLYLKQTAACRLYSTNPKESANFIVLKLVGVCV